ncbi:MAG TPA: uroporphyrinogen decarboxylase family protein [Cyclobacteriaceae bacterium]|nr:uroporphyrinogen decarboxylase family protein [Cyclobacteriaceae bacterium]
MNSKERVKTSLSHNNPDRIAIDFGSTPVTGIHVLAIERLRSYYGLKKKPVRVVEPYQMLGEIEDDLAEILSIDVIGLSPPNNMFGIRNNGKLQEFRTFWGQVVLFPEDFNTTLDPAGDLLIYPEGDTTAAPSARMPKTGYFFDAIIRQEPIVEDKLDPADNIEEFNPVSEADLDYWKAEVDKARKSGKAVVANFGGTAFGDIALVPGLNLKKPKGIRDVAEWYMSVVMRPDYIHTVFEKQSEIALENLKKIFAVVDNHVDVVFLCGTDFGTQDSQFCSKETLHELFVPYYRKINDWVHNNTSWKTFKHSCGSVEPFINSFIEAGFDILNPVQVNAKGMEPVHLKKTYGDQIVFWGGGVDTQVTLPFGTPEEVTRQVTEHCRIFSENGGFVFNTVHNIQANVPVQNIIAMIDAIKKFK